MVILGHGSDLTLAPTAGPIIRHAGQTLQQVLTRLTRAGFPAVQLDATLAGLRPRDLTPRARRDLLATLSRADTRLAGLDLFLPRRHYLEAAHLDRAVAATLAAIDLAADLGRVPLSLALPIRGISSDTLDTILEAADGRDVPLAIHAEDQLDDLAAWLNDLDQPRIGAAIDPAALIAGDRDPAQTAASLGQRLLVARLADCTGPAAQAASQRCPVGRGELDLTAYQLTIDLAANRRGPVILDLRNLESPLQAAETATRAWQEASPAGPQSLR